MHSHSHSYAVPHPIHTNISSTTTPSANQPRSILKNANTQYNTSNSQNNENHMIYDDNTAVQPPSDVSGIHWDEDNLQLNESEKVPRMKINEPKTPYQTSLRHATHDSNNSIGSMSDMQLDDDINDQSNTSQTHTNTDSDTDDPNSIDLPVYSTYTVSAANAPAPIDEKKHAEFQAKRHNFYKNEFAAVKQNSVQSDGSDDEHNDNDTNIDSNDDNNNTELYNLQHVNKRAKS